MKVDERKRLVKAHQTAQQLLADVRDIQRRTICVAVEELMLTAIEQVAHIRRLLGRLESQR